MAFACGPSGVACRASAPRRERLCSFANQTIQVVGFSGGGEMPVATWWKWLVLLPVFGGLYFLAKFTMQDRIERGDYGLVGPSRDAFVKSVSNSCFDRQSKRSTGLSPSILMRYCTCYGDQLANRMKPSDLEVNQPELYWNTAEGRDKMRVSAEACVSITKQ
jgi:hypothetical protein